MVKKFLLKILDLDPVPDDFQNSMVTSLSKRHMQIRSAVLREVANKRTNKQTNERRIKHTMFDEEKTVH